MAASLRTCSGSMPKVLQPARATAIAAITAMLMIRRVMVSSAGRTTGGVSQETCPHPLPVGPSQERVGEGAGSGRGWACATVDLAWGPRCPSLPRSRSRDERVVGDPEPERPVDGSRDPDPCPRGDPEVAPSIRRLDGQRPVGEVGAVVTQRDAERPREVARTRREPGCAAHAAAAGPSPRLRAAARSARISTHPGCRPAR